MASAVAAVAVMLACAGIILYLQRAGTLTGLDLGRTPAPGFSLTNQDGQRMSLDQFRGQPVVLTFLYTQCPDVCPLIADQLRQTSDLLGPVAPKVAMLAISTDPRHDDRASVLKFSQVHGMSGRWNYLLGSPDELTPVWQAYYVGVTPGDPAINEIVHSDALFLIDKQGRERTLLGVPFSAKELASNLRKLLAE